jgi:hypothetical protein
MNDPRRNPYAPPQAPLAEAPRSADPPPAVKAAMKLFWASLFLTFIEIAFDWERAAVGVAPMLIVILTVFMCSIQVLLYLYIARGRNWARITFLVLFVISLFVTLPSAPELARSAPLYAGVLAIDALLVLCALYLVFFPGRGWFGPRS